MNIIKTTGIVVLLIMLCTVCNKFPKEYEPIQPDNSRYLSVVAEVSETVIPMKIEENYEIELFGNATSCNMSQTGAPCITLNGIITHASTIDGFNLEFGELLLESTNSDCKLWGQFDGKGSLTGNAFVINSDVEVSCGTGLFKTNHGQLNMTITGFLPTENNPSPIYELTLSGQLDK